MKKFLIYLAALAAVSVSCQKETKLPESSTEGVIYLNIDPGLTGTRADAPDISSRDYETVIRKVDILVFNEQGQLNLYHPAGTSLNGIKLSVTTGQKEIWAVINGPDLSSVVRLADIKALKTMLEDNVISGDGHGFIMAGSQSCMVTPAAEGNECTLTVRRFAARVALTRLSVNMSSAYKEIKIDNVMLTNVVANQNLDGTAEPSVWYNKKGLTAGGAVIDGTVGKEADCPGLTFRTVGTTVQNKNDLTIGSPWYFYGYPNPTAADAAEADGSFKAEQTRLVITAEIDGQTYYYPVTLPSFVRNTAYEVELTIEGLGTDSPDTIPEKGVVNATVTIQPWGVGAVIIEKI